MTDHSTIATIHIYGDVTNSTIVVGNDNAVGASYLPYAVPLPVFDKESPLPLPGDLPAGSHLPFSRNPLFTGREVDLQAIAESLLSQNVGAVIKQAVTGMGGLGKTQLAVEFGYRFGRFFRGVHWLNMTNPEFINSEIATCGMQMGLPNFPDDLPSQVILTVNTWKVQGPHLLILDNFEKVGLVNQVMRHFNHSNLRVLLTSRHSDWSPSVGLNLISLEVFSKEESLAFLKKTQQKRKDADEELASLGERLGYLPLALELASRYLNDHSHMTISVYLAQLDHILEHPSMKNWREETRGRTTTQHDTNLLNTFALSWSEVKDETTQKMFMLAGYLAPNTPIPLVIFERTLENISKNKKSKLINWLQNINILFILLGYLISYTPIPLEILKQTSKGVSKNKKINQDDWHRKIFKKNISDLPHTVDSEGALSVLYDFGLLTPKNNFPSIHPLLAEYARILAQKDSTLFESLTDTVVTLSMEAGNTGLPEKFIPLSKHLPILAAHAELAKYKKAGVLWNNYGYHLREIGDFAGARESYEHALKFLEKLLSQNDSIIAVLVNNLGLVLNDLGDLPTARQMFERALKIDETAFHENHPTIAIRVNNLGLILLALGDFQGALQMFKRAVKIWEINLGIEDPQVAIGVNNLGGALRELGNLHAARQMFERALKIDETNFGVDHPNVARDVNNLGGILKDLGDLPAAHQMFERALKIDETNFDVDHPNVARDVNNLGVVLQTLGDLSTARQMFERALKIDEVAFGTDHSNVAIRANNIGVILKDLGNPNAARQMIERALKVDEAAFGKNHPNVARDVNNLGIVLQGLGDLPAARQMFERAINICGANLGPDHPRFATGINNLGFVLKDQDDLPAACQMYECALKIFEEQLGGNHPYVATLVNNLGMALQDLGDLSPARQMYERALKIDKAVFGTNHTNVARDVNNLGTVLKALGDLDGAREAFERALTIFKKFLPPDHLNIKTVQRNLDSLDE